MSPQHHLVSAPNPVAERGQVLLNAFGEKKVSPEEVGNLSNGQLYWGFFPLCL